MLYVKILVADDNDAIRTALCELLQQSDPTYICESARDGNEALAIAKASKPDVVILDMLMPGMGGLSSARLICHCLPGTKILLHTAYRNDMLEANGARYGVFRVVDKTDGRNLLAIISDSGSLDPSV
jgi:CheY-like chemotaxis protein